MLKRQDWNVKKTEEASLDDFVQAMAHAAFGVSVVTTDGPAGRFGLTVSAISSVSAEPPLLLACINRKNPIAEALTRNGAFYVNLLSQDQWALARIFAGRPRSGPAYDFTAGHWQETAGRAPRLLDCAANFDCNLESWHDAGTHRIFIGRAIRATHGGLLPLVYSHRKFGHFLAVPEANS
jgi:flavin reductase (DIM6/NTAB) family NADH-FMN oxidoreductase RutF